MIDLKRFDDRVITPRDDALIFSFMTAGQCGIFDGLTVSHLGANQIKVSDGRGMVMGRDFIIGEETIAAELSTSGTVKGRLTIRIDLANEAVPIEFVTVAADTLPTPVQEEINHDGSVFELPLCEYDIDTTQISNLEMVAQILTPPGGSQTEIGSYLGDGAAARDIDLGYKPTIVFVFRQGDPFVFLSASSATNIYSGVVCELGASKGIYAIDNGFKVLQNGSDPPDGKRACLNESGKTYVYIAKK